MNVKSAIGADDNLPPLLWGWIAGERNSARYDRLYDLSVGSGIEDETRFAAKMYCDLAIQERLIETELATLIKTDMRFLPYRKVFARFGFGIRAQGIILSQFFLFRISLAQTTSLKLQQRGGVTLRKLQKSAVARHVL
jgi:hypothetical protein